MGPYCRTKLTEAQILTLNFVRTKDQRKHPESNLIFIRCPVPRTTYNLLLLSNTNRSDNIVTAHIIYNKFLDIKRRQYN